MQKQDLLFQNPVFESGLNVTVRKGDKWMKVDIGDIVNIKETGKDEIISVGIIAGKALLPASLVPKDFLKYEHDPACRNLPGLMQVMEKVYPDFTPDNLVTVLLFEI